MKKFLILNLGALLVAIGCMIFLSPPKLAAGGVFGIGVVMQYFFEAMPIGIIMLILNVILFIIGFIFLGFSFGISTFYTTAMLSVYCWLIEVFIPISEPITEDLFIQLVIGIIISSTGMALIFNQNSSTGGTDIVAKIINKYCKISIGTSLILVDLIISISAGFIFSIDIALYSFLGCLLNGIMIDYFIKFLNKNNQVTIFTNNYKNLNEFISETLEAEVLIINAISNNGKLISTVLSNKKLEKLKTYIEEYDNQAFMVVCDLKECRTIKVKSEEFEFQRAA